MPNASPQWVTHETNRSTSLCVWSKDTFAQKVLGGGCCAFRSGALSSNFGHDTVDTLAFFQKRRRIKPAHGAHIRRMIVHYSAIPAVAGSGDLLARAVVQLRQRDHIEVARDRIGLVQ